MMHCVNAVPTTANLYYYVKVVKDYSYGVIAEFYLLTVIKEYLLESTYNFIKEENIKLANFQLN